MADVNVLLRYQLKLLRGQAVGSEGVRVGKGDLVAFGPGPLHIVKRCEGDELDAFCGVLFRGYDSIDRYFVGREDNHHRFSDQVCDVCESAYRPSQWDRLKNAQEPF